MVIHNNDDAVTRERSRCVELVRAYAGDPMKAANLIEEGASLTQINAARYDALKAEGQAFNANQPVSEERKRELLSQSGLGGATLRNRRQ